MDQYSALVWSLARRFTDNTADAEDASQEIFLEVWKSASRYESGKGSEAVFITTIARRRLIDRLRSKNRRPETEELNEEALPAGESVAPAAVMFASEVDAAQAALAALEPGQREVLLLGVVEGLTHSEIALRTGKPLGTVKTQMRRGLVKLKQRLGAGEEAADE